MGAAYSQDLRDRVIAARDRGLNTKPVAELFDVSASWVRRVMQRRREQQAGRVGRRRVIPESLRALIMRLAGENVGSGVRGPPHHAASSSYQCNTPMIQGATPPPAGYNASPRMARRM
jgi:hypothetical protein